MKSSTAEKAVNTCKCPVLLTVNEVARILQVSVSTVYKWVDENRLSYIDLGVVGKRRCLRFKHEALIKLIEEKSRN